MLGRHSHVIAMIGRDRSIKYLVRDYFALSVRQALMPALLGRGLGQADLVLCLLRLRDRHHLRMINVYVHLLVGRPILIGEPCLLRYATNGRPTATRSPLAEDRRVIYVQPDNPRQPSTEAHGRWREFKVGRSISQLRIRGVTKRDLRRAVRRGWVRLEEAA